MKSKEEYNFHLTDLSPWPIIVSFAIFFLSFGLVSALHKKFFGVLSLVFGVLILSIVLFYWWRDIVREFSSKKYNLVIDNSLRIGMYLFIFSEIVFFAVFFFSFFEAWLDPTPIFNGSFSLRRTKWPPEGIYPPNPWSFPFINTLLLLLSGTTANLAHHSLFREDKKNTIKMLLTTILLGVLFVVIQTIEYFQVSFSLQETGEKMIYISHFYMITGFHCTHVIIGIIFLLICLFRVQKNQFTSKKHLCFEFAVWYWHFVDAMWILLFVSVYWLSVFSSG